MSQRFGVGGASSPFSVRTPSLDHIPVPVGKKTLFQKTTIGNMSSQSTTSGAGEQFLLPDCTAKAPVKDNVLFTDRYLDHVQ